MLTKEIFSLELRLVELAVVSLSLEQLTALYETHLVSLSDAFNKTERRGTSPKH
jgi:hypothetical protein